MKTTHHVKLNDDSDGDVGGSIIIGGGVRKPYQYFSSHMEVKQHHFYISEEIGEPYLYTDMIHKIATAGVNDTVYIHINSPGGDLSTGLQIIAAMQNTEARVVTYLEGMAYSLATLIFLAGHELIINDHCLFMIHNFSGGMMGKGHEMTSQLDATNKWFSALAKKMYLPFLTEDELHRVIKGEDIWMQSAEIRKRLDKIVKGDVASTIKPKKIKTLKPVDVE
jgi:ATP-dependent protease ClpP protease subunit